MKKLKSVLISGLILLTLISLACQKNVETAENNNAAIKLPEASQTVRSESVEPLQKKPVDITKLANKTSADIDEMLGQPEEIKEISQPKKGEYRLYKIADEPKGLAVRFYGGRAKNFNLILTLPATTAREALKETFAIDVGSKPAAKDVKEPLSEKWSGEFGGVKFASVYAKRESESGGFVFVLAEVAE